MNVIKIFVGRAVEPLQKMAKQEERSVNVQKNIQIYAKYVANHAQNVNAILMLPFVINADSESPKMGNVRSVKNFPKKPVISAGKVQMLVSALIAVSGVPNVEI